MPVSTWQSNRRLSQPFITQGFRDIICCDDENVTTVINLVSNSPTAAPLNDATGLTCLADSADYQRLNGKRIFILKYWHALALVPFFLAIVFGVNVLPRLVPDTAFWASVAEFLIVGSLIWAGIVLVYSFSVFTCFLFIRCPRCGWRFGLSERCGSCGLARTRNNLIPI